MKENKIAAQQLRSIYSADIMGKIANNIYNFHKDKEIVYKLYAEAEDVYEDIVEKYNDQFNLKWSGNIHLY